MIRALIFDCFGVFYPDPVIAYEHEPDASLANVRILSTMSDQAALGNLSKARYIAEASTLLGRTPEIIEHQFFESTSRNEAVVALIHALRKQAYKIGLLTNIGSDMITSYFTTADYEDLFDAFVISGEVAMSKPDPRIFKLICDKLDIPFHEAIMIDDNPVNVAGAQELGMQSIRYTDFEQLKVELSTFIPLPE